MNRFGWLVRRISDNAWKLNPETGRLAMLFRTVRSEEDCVQLLNTEGLLDAPGLSEATCDLLDGVCRSLRADGMAMEPNLLGRTAARSILNRTLAGTVSIAFAGHDTDFLEQAGAADAARDLRDFETGRHKYSIALQMFPYHPSYLIQYAHCLKEVDRLPDALVAYIDAYYFGAPKDDLETHAMYVAERIGRQEQMAAILKLNVDASSDETGSMGWALTSGDVITLTELFHSHTPTPTEIVRRMCEHRSRRELALALLGQSQFGHVHRDLLRIMSDPGLKK